MNTDPADTDLAIEHQKLKLEREKVRLERLKARWTAISIIVPLVVASLSISFGIWSQAKQARFQSEMQAQANKLQLELQAQQAKSQFEMKAAEIVMTMEVVLPAELIGTQRQASATQHSWKSLP